MCTLSLVSVMRDALRDARRMIISEPSRKHFGKSQPSRATEGYPRTLARPQGPSAISSAHEATAQERKIADFKCVSARDVRASPPRTGRVQRRPSLKRAASDRATGPLGQGIRASPPRTCRAQQRASHRQSANAHPRSQPSVPDATRLSRAGFGGVYSATTTP